MNLLGREIWQKKITILSQIEFTHMYRLFLEISCMYVLQNFEFFV